MAESKVSVLGCISNVVLLVNMCLTDFMGNMLTFYCVYPLQRLAGE